MVQFLLMVLKIGGEEGLKTLGNNLNLWFNIFKRGALEIGVRRWNFVGSGRISLANPGRYQTLQHLLA